MRLSLLLVFALGCSAAPEPREPEPTDGGTPADCEAACARLAELGCPEAEPTPDGVTCVDFCTEVEASGTVTLEPACVAAITACSQIDRCAP